MRGQEERHMTEGRGRSLCNHTGLRVRIGLHDGLICLDSLLQIKTTMQRTLAESERMAERGEKADLELPEANEGVSDIPQNAVPVKSQ